MSGDRWVGQQGRTVATKRVSVDADGCQIPVLLQWSRPADGRAVVVIHEKYGLDDHVVGIARRLAEAGFATVSPDLLARAGGSAGGTAVLPGGARGTPRSWLLDDLRRSVDRACELLHVRRFGVVGYSLGGEFAWQLASQDDRCRALVDVHGMPPQSEMRLGHLAALSIFSEVDEMDKARAAVRLGDQLGMAHVEVIPGVRRGFDDHTRPDRFHSEPAERVWKLIVSWLRGHLVGAGHHARQ